MSDAGVSLAAGQTALALVVAHTRNRVIGRDNGMPWHLPADLAYFRALTMGHPILMGRRTQAAIGRALPGRRNLVLTRQGALELPGVETVTSVDAALALVASAPLLFVIGGAEVYRQVLPQATRLYVTEIATELEGDTWFPALPPGEWQEVARTHHPADDRNAWDLDFVTLERRVSDVSGLTGASGLPGGVSSLSSVSRA